MLYDRLALSTRVFNQSTLNSGKAYFLKTQQSIKELPPRLDRRIIDTNAGLLRNINLIENADVFEGINCTRNVLWLLLYRTKPRKLCHKLCHNLTHIFYRSVSLGENIKKFVEISSGIFSIITGIVASGTATATANGLMH